MDKLKVRLSYSKFRKDCAISDIYGFNLSIVSYFNIKIKDIYDLNDNLIRYPNYNLKSVTIWANKYYALIVNIVREKNFKINGSTFDLLIIPTRKKINVPVYTFQLSNLGIRNFKIFLYRFFRWID